MSENQNIIYDNGMQDWNTSKKSDSILDAWSTEIVGFR